MEKINERIRKKQEQIERTEERLKKYKDQLKSYEKQKEEMKIKDLLKVLDKKGLDITEATSLLANKEVGEEIPNNHNEADEETHNNHNEERNRFQ